MNDDMFEQLLESVREGASILKEEASASRTFEMQRINIQQLRARYKLSQRQFASLLGISAATLRNWEQGRRTPVGPARILLQVAARHPEVLLENIRPTEKMLARKAASRAKRSKQPPHGN
jgi:putative transcriptional regulator